MIRLSWPGDGVGLSRFHFIDLKNNPSRLLMERRIWYSSSLRSCTQWWWRRRRWSCVVQWYISWHRWWWRRWWKHWCGIIYSNAELCTETLLERHSMRNREWGWSRRLLCCWFEWVGPIWYGSFEVWCRRWWCEPRFFGLWLVRWSWC